jgi:DNA polymerase-3 subunit epsilon
VIWQSFRHGWARRRLKRPAFAYLFDDPPPQEWVSVDCETTGLDRKNDEILSIGAVKVQGDRILASERLELIIRPSGKVNPESIRVHRLRSMDLVHGLEPEEAIERFLAYVGPRPLLGYYLEFDVAMLNRLVKPFLGIELPQRQIEVSGIYYDYKFDQINGANVDLRFSSIMKDLKLPEREEHDAFNDALMAAMIFLKLRHLRGFDKVK